jgi:hypothetical protein
MHTQEKIKKALIYISQCGTITASECEEICKAAESKIERSSDEMSIEPASEDGTGAAQE